MKWYQILNVKMFNDKFTKCNIEESTMDQMYA